MLHPILEETWTLGPSPKLISRIGIRDAVDGWEAAYSRATSLASDLAEQRGFIHDFEHGEQNSFAWARAKDDPTVIHRFVVL
jgi:hypothetical protein